MIKQLCSRDTSLTLRPISDVIGFREWNLGGEKVQVPQLEEIQGRSHNPSLKKRKRGGKGKRGKGRAGKRGKGREGARRSSNENTCR